jgi:hypothetical protein
MAGLVEILRSHARILQREAAARTPAALARLRALTELAALDDEALAAAVKRRHALAAIALELGFEGWPHAAAVLAGERADDFGKLLYPKGGAAHWNLWSADYEEARALRKQHGGWLLAYQRHYFIVDRYFLETLGLDPDDADWERIGRDWVRPRDPAARERLYARLIRQRPAFAELPLPTD